MRLLATGLVASGLGCSSLFAATKAQESATPDSASKAAPATSTNIVSAPAPSTPREYFNAGTQQLRAGKFREAEAFLESALSSQKDELQYPSLYNLGHVRFDQGAEELKKKGPAGPTVAQGKAAGQAADGAIRAADAALASNEVDKMVAAYMNGRGVKKELKAATTAVEQALKVYRGTLSKWERASGDFKGAVEIKTSDADAEHNAEVVDRCIAKLVDSLKQMQQCASGMSDKGRELGDKLQKLKGRIPAPNMPPGAAGDDDEEEDMPFGQKPNQKEGSTKEGQQMNMTPEQAGWLLDGFKLDSERRLPMGQNQTGQPKDRTRPTW